MDATLADPLVGQVLDGRYRVESRIARGGMATVYLGRDTKLDRVVALKVMRPNLVEDEDFVRRFISEAKSAAALSHPNVVGVYDQAADRGHVFLAMEYVPGRTLRDLLAKRGRLGPREALEVMQPILAALGAAHRAGLMHRDVKPENVLLTDDGQVKVVDFGLARAVATGTRHTKTGVVIGTVGYLAPEQVLTGTADARSDVYAAGVLLFELLTGHQPHRGETPLSVAYKHVNEVVPPPSTVVPGLPPQLDALVAAATNHDPARRPQDANHLLGAAAETYRSLPQNIDYLLAANPAVPEPPTAGEPLRQAPTTSYPGSATQTLPTNSRTAVVPSPELPRPQSFMERLAAMATSRYVLVGLGLIAVAVLGWTVWSQTAGQYTHVPRQLVGMSVEEAQLKAESDGLKVEVGKARNDEKIAKDYVVEVQPAPGTEVKKGMTVTLIPSKGPTPVSVPDVAGKPLDQAKQELTNRGLIPGAERPEFSNTVPRGSVIRTEPAAGRMQDRAKGVVLIVSSGIKVPDLRGMKRQEAANSLRKLGLTPVIQMQEDQGHSRGTVINQDPQPNTGIDKGGTVTLTIAKGHCQFWDFLCQRDNNNDDNGDDSSGQGRR